MKEDGLYFLFFLHFLTLFSAQDTWSQPQGYPIQRALTSLDPEDARAALEINKLVVTVTRLDCK